MGMKDAAVEMDGDCVVVPDGGSLPRRCLKCGAPAAAESPTRFAFTWNPHGLRMAGKVSGIPAVLTNRRGRIWAYYCSAHRPRVARNAAILLVLSAGGFAVAVTHFNDEHFTFVGPGIVTGVGMLTWALAYIAMPPLKLKCEKIEEGRLWIAPSSYGARESFRAEICGPVNRSTVQSS